MTKASRRKSSAKKSTVLALPELVCPPPIPRPGGKLGLVVDRLAATGCATIEQAADLANRWPCLRLVEKRELLEKLVTRVTVRSETVDISVRLAHLPHVVMAYADLDPGVVPEHARETLLSVPARLKRIGRDMKLLLNSPAHPKPDRSLMRLLGQAQRFHEMVMTSQGKTMAGLAAEAGVNESYFSRVFQLSFLAPGITQAIARGHQPPELSANKLMLATKLVPGWSDQRLQLGFG